MFRIPVLSALIALCPAAIAGVEPPSAIETATRLHQALRYDTQQQDWDAYLADAQALKGFLNGSPDGTLAVARAYLHLGRTADALREAHEFVAMGQVTTALDSSESVSAPLAASMRANAAMASRAHRVFALQDPGLLPEDIDYDPRSQRFFITSVLGQKIIVVDQHGVAHDFARSPDHWPMMAIKVDAQRHRLWATEVAVTGFSAVAQTDQGRSVLLEFDLDRAVLLNRYEGPPNTALADMVLDAAGEPIVSDGDNGGIYRLQAGMFQRIDHGDFVSPQTIARCADDHTVFVPDYARGIARLDLNTGTVVWLASEGRYALQGIDGLYCNALILIATQNGTSPERVQQFLLDASFTSIVAESPIERGTHTLRDPTHGVWVGRDFFYIANSGWDTVDEHGRVKAGTTMTAALLMRAPIPGAGP